MNVHVILLEVHSFVESDFTLGKPVFCYPKWRTTKHWYEYTQVHDHTFTLSLNTSMDIPYLCHGSATSHHSFRGCLQ